MKNTLVPCLAVLCTAVFVSNTNVGAAEETRVQRDARMQWWREAKFGMFVHWGVYSVTGGEYKGQKLPNSAEWMMNRGKIPIAEYEQYAAQFNPTNFDATAFVCQAKEAGMKYIVITSKHHDGFCMFHSKAGPYNVVDATPFKRDIMKELAIACREQGLRFGFYYSQAQDWHQPGGFGNNWDKTLKQATSDEYVRDKACPDVKQLLTEYGSIGIFWWDTPRKMSPEAFQSIFSLTSLQPDVITNDRLGDDFPGDYKTFERRIPDKAPPGKDWEVCMTISDSWGYKLGDTDFKSPKTLVRNLVDIVSKGGNYLLNVSPTGEGILLPQSVASLKGIGQWMKNNSESIYGTTASPFGSLKWGRCTKKAFGSGAVLYLHVFDWPTNGELLVPGVTNAVLQTYLMGDLAPLKVRHENSGVVVSLPPQAPDEIDTVIVMKVAGALNIEGAQAVNATGVLAVPNSDGSLVLTPPMAYIHNNEGSKQASLQKRGETPHIGHWTDQNAWVEWSFKIDRPGRYEIWADMALEKGPGRFQIGLPKKQATAEVAATGNFDKFVKMRVGEIIIDQAGDYTLQMNPEPEHWQPINVRELVLKPE